MHHTWSFQAAHKPASQERAEPGEVGALTEATSFIMWGALVPDQGAERSVSLTP